MGKTHQFHNNTVAVPEDKKRKRFTVVPNVRKSGFLIFVNLIVSHENRQVSGADDYDC